MQNYWICEFPSSWNSQILKLREDYQIYSRPNPSQEGRMSFCLIYYTWVGMFHKIWWLKIIGSKPKVCKVILLVKIFVNNIYIYLLWTDPWNYIYVHDIFTYIYIFPGLYIIIVDLDDYYAILLGEIGLAAFRKNHIFVLLVIDILNTSMLLCVKIKTLLVKFVNDGVFYLF